MEKVSETLNNVIQKSKGGRQVGDTKTDSNGKTLVWTETKPGTFDWRVKKDGNGGGGGSQKQESGDEYEDPNKFSKLQQHLQNTDVDSLKRFAKKPGNAPKLRQAAYDELVARGEDVSDIDLNTGKYGQMKQAFGVGQQKTDFKLNADGGLDLGEDEDVDWKDPEFIKKYFGFSDWAKATKAQRIAYDKFVTAQKAKDPNYIPPEEEIYDLNALYAQFLMTDSPLMIASGGAGVGKTHNLHLVAKAMSKRPFDPDTDTPGDADYDYVEAPEANTAPKLANLLKEHNGKTIVFDDADSVLKTPDTLGILKKATASSGKRIIGFKSSNAGTNVDPFEFTGKILFLTNMNQAQLTKDENLNAVFSRALKKDIYFTKQEQLHFIEKLRHQFEFTGIERLPNKKDDIEERDAIFNILKDNIEDIDPAKFNVRSMKEMLEVKRAADRAADFIKNDPVMGKMLFGNAGNWEKKVKSLLIKGEGYSPKKENLEKAKEILELDSTEETETEA